MAAAATFETLIFDDCSGTVTVQWLAENRYRIIGPEIVVMSEQYGCGDIIEAVRNGDNALVVKRCIERGNYRMLDYVLPAGWEESDAIRKVLAKVEQQGGIWEGIFGGVLLIALPPEADYDPSQEIEKIAWQ